METLLTSQDAMIAYGKSLITHGSKFLLYGDLGSGKTTLTKGIAEGLGIDGDHVQSPTYTYIHIYEQKLLHIDMRRIQKKEDVFNLGIYDLIDQFDYIVIERPKREDSFADDSWQRIYLTERDTARLCIREPY